ncbi:hypothetical protein B5X24_HaOG204524 [Helicoverpa armigera]|uniref:Uncharacterized protein n=1 Tax=Helicoverpa armigera TaxID=29058 RepID=A0A2W1BN18_HELAM|nr:hypothetical protein B5X24_HaOG204524 [Helicoverpa armigera]
MKYLSVIFLGVVIELTSSRYIRFPSGLEVWIQKVKVYEVNEYGQEIHPHNNYDDEEPLIDIRSAYPSNPGKPGWPQKPFGTGNIIGSSAYGGISGDHCPTGRRVGNKCIVPDK